MWVGVKGIWQIVELSDGFFFKCLKSLLMELQGMNKEWEQVKMKRVRKRWKMQFKE